MKLLQMPLERIFPLLLHAILLPCILSSSPSQQPGNTTDRHALLSFKTSITGDPRGALSSWSNHSLQFCQWRGVTCGDPRRRPSRVTSLDLDSLNLVGSISPSLANLTFLQNLHLSNNQLQGHIPQELTRLVHLQYLNLSHNSIDGEIPANLSGCKHLQVISLSNNMLVGEIPVDLGSLSDLVHLSLSVNNLTGNIPSSLGNLSFLTLLSLAGNNLDGSIPKRLGSIHSLRYFQVGLNKLSGKIPTSLYNISNLYEFSVGGNQLFGTIPPDIGLTLPNLHQLSMFSNQFDGSIPMSLSNASGLEKIGLDHNMFIGTIPTNLGKLENLSWVILSRNKLESGDWSFLTSLTNCSNLVYLELNRNELRGVLPRSITNFSTNLNWFTIGDNHISGSIPTEIDKLVGLNALFMEENLLTGVIPSSIGKLKGLQSLWLFDNRLLGEIPSSLGNLTQLNELYLEVNQLHGSIPKSFGGLSVLITLNISYNNLSGEIPRELVSLSSISRYIDLAYNSLTGFLPAEVGSLRNLLEFNVSNNKLSGEIPATLGECEVLEYLYMNSNQFEGSIPQSLSNLKGIQEMNFSHNNLSGRIPEYFEIFQLLQYLNLSFNNFEGQVPITGVFANLSATSIMGNNELCGGIQELHLPVCSQTYLRRKGASVVKIVLPIVGGILFANIVICLLFFRRRRRKMSGKIISPSTGIIDDKFMRVSYSELLKATDGFSSSNLIGTGSFRSVYKRILDRSGEEVAVKIINLQQEGGSKSFTAECEALKNIRHRNLLKVITSSSTIDSKGDDFKAIVYEFMLKGSVDEWLHQEMNLSFVERLNIATDVAFELDYLHHHSQTPILHCDLKPSNVLIDKDMVAHVGDFGLARFLLADTENSFQIPSISTLGLKGSIGYVAPEYGTGSTVSTQGDIYSYGVFLLEMFTGIRPTNAMFKDDLNLHKYTKMFFPERIKDVVDRRLLIEEDIEQGTDDREIKEDTVDGSRQCLVSIFEIGLRCSEEEPRNRMQMGVVAETLQAFRESFLS
ncbi:LRR receptor-like serine/threonine-protein kinase EFR [Typha angustifolia]|uniref:LRR receptor-like serine/threonine-protein kinase EFR n=1 Tax=Typha angustifolia TaxID=59011 RepID=UPI003C2C033C